MSKKHLINIWFDTDMGAFAFVGFVTTSVFSPSKLFKVVFGFDMPDDTQITLM